MFGIAIIVELILSVLCIFKAASIAKKDNKADAVKVAFIDGICLILFGIGMAFYGNSKGFLFSHLSTFPFSVSNFLVGFICGLSISGALLLKHLLDDRLLWRDNKTLCILLTVASLVIGLALGFGTCE